MSDLDYDPYRLQRADEHRKAKLARAKEKLRAKAGKGSSNGKAAREPVTSVARVMSARERKNSRTKGSRAELDVAKMFSKWCGEVVRRTPMSGGWSNARFGVTADLVCTKKAFPHVEIKHHEEWFLDDLVTGAREDHKTSIRQWWIQCVESCPKADGRLAKLPLLVFRRNRQPWLVMLPRQALPYLAGVDFNYVEYWWQGFPDLTLDNVTNVIVMRLDSFLDTIEVPKGLRNHGA